MWNPGRKEGIVRKIICDKCHKEIPEKPVKIYLNRVDPKTGDFEETVGEDLEDIDLCEECSKALAAKIKAFSHRTEELSGQNPAKKKDRQGKSDGTQECRVDDKSHSGRNELLTPDDLQRHKESP